jgi:triphosphoribosyl-dephospho-CoA synthase
MMTVIPLHEAGAVQTDAVQMGAVQMGAVRDTGPLADDRVDELADRLADMAVAALVDEAMLTPKPGLVDTRGNGAHRDLNWMLMCESAWTLRPAFRAMAVAGQRIAGAQALRDYIGAAGRSGERDMMRATGGVNTHRGAIWALGLLVTAAAQDPAALGAAQVARRAGALARRHDGGAPAAGSPAAGLNKGALACALHGVGGARGQAQAGFPQVVGAALPELARSRRRGDGETAARLNALLAVIAELDDTCLLARGGQPALAAAQGGARRVLANGGAASAEGRTALGALEHDMLRRGVSPGGAADLLAAALLLDRIEQISNITAEDHHGKTGV